MKQKLQSLQESIKSCSHSERQRFLKRLNQLSKPELTDDKALERLRLEVERALERRKHREENVPAVHFTHDLPIHEYLQTIKAKLIENQVLIICGETGSGKTTQLPKLCLEAGFGIDGFIGHTQPRRIAAKTIASRISQELDAAVGEVAGYKIRHSDKTSKDSYIKVMTDGILLAEMQRDRFLNAYDVLIIDEAHERSLNIDFILGYLNQILAKRPELRLIVTSATIDVERFSKQFHGAPIIEVSGRTYPVELRYRPIEHDEDEPEELKNEQGLLSAIEELSKEDPGDILVFLNGEREIHDMMKYLRKQQLPGTEILPLYGRLGSAGQGKVFKAHNKRHIILSTNVAETSLTISGIRHVIDFGYARISRYSYRSKVQRLPIEKISQASAEQRKGRCGRTAEGICIRLFSEEDFEQRPRYTEPEILRTNLASVILQMKSQRLGEIEAFPFIDPPNQRYINDGIRLLKELRALDDNDALTTVGRQLARLPIDPRLARILLAANDWNCVKEILVIVSALSIQDPRERPLDASQKADEAHARFYHKHSDFMSFINLWNFYQEHKGELSRNRLNKLCKTNFLSITRMREWHDIHQQLIDQVDELGFSINKQDADYNNIHCALLTGLLSHVAIKSDDREYTGARSVKLHIFPGSNQFKALPKWIVAGELSETSKLYARVVAKIDPKWLLKPAKHLLQRSCSEPHWDEKKQHISAYETISLYGLVIVPRQIISYGRINQAEARKLFITEGLVNQRLDSQASFYIQNQKIINDIRLLEHKARRMDVLDEEAVFEFYDQRLADSVNSLQSLNGWRKQAERDNPNVLYMNKENIMRHEAENINSEYYPDQIQINHLNFPLNYEFKPGDESDGVNVEVPLAVLNQLKPSHFERLVPGLLEEKITALIKSLPKQYRKQFVPVPDVAKECAKALNNNEQTLTNNLTEYLFRSRGVKIPVESWQSERTSDHLQMNICVVDEKGNCIEQGRDVNELKERFAEVAANQFSMAGAWEIERNQITDWDFDELPEFVEKEVTGTQLKGYPVLEDLLDSVSIKVVDTQQKANVVMRPGLRRLYILNLNKELKYLRKNLPELEKLKLYSSHLYKQGDLTEEIIEALVDKFFIEEYGITRTKQGFEEILNRASQKLVPESVALCELLLDIFKYWHDIHTELSSNIPASMMKSLNDIKSQLNVLFYPGFIKDVPYSWLKNYPRYLQAIEKRLHKLETSSSKDTANLAKIQPLWQSYIELRDLNVDSDNVCPELEHYRWMLEEYRVSLFAQELKTAIPVSKERLANQMKRVRNSAQDC